MNVFHRVALELKAIAFGAGAALAHEDDPQLARQLEAKALACTQLVELATRPAAPSTVFAPPDFKGFQPGPYS